MRGIGIAGASLLLLAGCGSRAGGPGTPGAGGGGGGGIFEAPNVWSQPVDGVALHPQSQTMIDRLVADGGFGLGRVQIDFSISVLEADGSTPLADLVQAPGYYLPDCDAPAKVPLPPGGAVEGESGYACAGGGDCHLLVIDRRQKRLYEAYAASETSATRISALCVVVWDLARTYPTDLRGDQCTSADAAGLPIAPLLFSADEVAAGSVDHAIRFILPNARIRAGVFVHPATHAGAPSGAADAIPYGGRLRLKAGFDLRRLPTEGARVVARAMQRYGMILADGGSVALTARDDRFTTRKWSEVGIDARSLDAIGPSDFEVVGSAAPRPLTYDCVRNGQ
jgi:hypothetical protein